VAGADAGKGESAARRRAERGADRDRGGVPHHGVAV